MRSMNLLGFLILSHTLASGHAAANQPSSPYPIGVAVSQTSNVALFGQEQVTGAQLAEEYFNNNPQNSAVKIKLIFEDVGGDEMATINAFNALMKKDVLGIVGPTLSQQAFAADPLANRAKIPVIGPSNTAKGIPQIGPYISRVSAPIAQVAPHALEAALKQNPAAKKVAVLFAQNDAYSSSEATTFQETVKAHPALETVSVQKFQTTDTDFTTQIMDIMRTKPDIVIISALASDGGNLVKQLRQSGYKGPIVAGNGLNTPNVFPVCQKYCDGILIAQAYSPQAPFKLNQTFLEMARKKSGKAPGQFTAQAFTAVQVFVEALRAVDAKKKLATHSLAALREALNQELLSQSYQTVLGPIRFDKDGDIIQDQFYVATIRMEQDGKNGRFDFIN